MPEVMKIPDEINFLLFAVNILFLCVNFKNKINFYTIIRWIKKKIFFYPTKFPQ